MTLLLILLAFPLTTHAFNEERYAERLLSRLECKAEIEFRTNLLVRDAWGMYWKGKISLRRGLSRRWLRYTLIHECGHELNERLNSPIFGRPPFVTREAKQDRAEDFAESYRCYKQGFLRDGAKFDFFNKHLDND